MPIDDNRYEELSRSVSWLTDYTYEDSTKLIVGMFSHTMCKENEHLVEYGKRIWLESEVDDKTESRQEGKELNVYGDLGPSARTIRRAPFQTLDNWFNRACPLICLRHVPNSGYECEFDFMLKGGEARSAKITSWRIRNDLSDSYAFSTIFQDWPEVGQWTEWHELPKELRSRLRPLFKKAVDPKASVYQLFAGYDAEPVKVQQLIRAGIISNPRSLWRSIVPRRDLLPYAGFSMRAEPVAVVPVDDLLEGKVDLAKYEKGLTIEAFRDRLPAGMFAETESTFDPYVTNEHGNKVCQLINVTVKAYPLSKFEGIGTKLRLPKGQK